MSETIDVFSSPIGTRSLKELIADSVPAIVVFLDGDLAGHIAVATREAESLFGYIEGELEGKHIGDLIPDRLREAHAGHVARYAMNPTARRMGESNMKLVGLRRDGREFTVEISLRPRAVHGTRIVVLTMLERTG